MGLRRTFSHFEKLDVIFIGLHQLYTDRRQAPFMLTRASGRVRLSDYSTTPNTISLRSRRDRGSAIAYICSVQHDRDSWAASNTPIFAEELWRLSLSGHRCIRTTRDRGGVERCGCAAGRAGPAHRQEARPQTGRHAATPHRPNPPPWFPRRVGGEAVGRPRTLRSAVIDHRRKFAADGQYPFPVVYSQGVSNYHENFQDCEVHPGPVTGRSGTHWQRTFSGSSDWHRNTALCHDEASKNMLRSVRFLSLYANFGLCCRHL